MVDFLKPAMPEAKHRQHLPPNNEPVHQASDRIAPYVIVHHIFNHGTVIAVDKAMLMDPSLKKTAMGLIFKHGSSFHLRNFRCNIHGPSEWAYADMQCLPGSNRRLRAVHNLQPDGGGAIVA